jgi:ABC-type molybdenum transport system ATPase subunit/photorepair protein PhrA
MICQEVAVTTTPSNSAYRRGRGNRFEFLSGDEARPLQNLPKNSKVSKQQRLIEVDPIDVYYGRVKVLVGITMDVSEGELVTLLGPNGAGKSTLVEQDAVKSLEIALPHLSSFR